MLKEAEYLSELQKAVELKHQCQAAHDKTVLVSEKTVKNESVWSGYVEIFDLTGHKEAKRCYAWQDIDSNGIRIFTVLENHFIDSAQRAIQAAIFVDAEAPSGKSGRNLDKLKKRIEAGKKALYDAEIRAEDLNAMTQS